MLGFVVIFGTDVFYPRKFFTCIMAFDMVLWWESFYLRVGHILLWGWIFHTWGFKPEFFSSVDPFL